MATGPSGLSPLALLWNKICQNLKQSHFSRDPSGDLTEGKLLFGKMSQMWVNFIFDHYFILLLKVGWVSQALDFFSNNTIFLGFPERLREIVTNIIHVKSFVLLN